ncbi:MAG: autotransporter outer membrane beta-barrel domain-containing protein [Verrucomicrobiales bacterium]|nr:autotransporter outer membrane beta-barrel domain-containing protein [Verrucomicrobiales bacterium]
MSNLIKSFSLICTVFFLTPVASFGQRVIHVGDSMSTITTPPGLTAGDEIRFSGEIRTSMENGVDFTAPLPFPINLVFTSSSVVSVDGPIFGGDHGVYIGGDFEGTFSNAGLIESIPGSGVEFGGSFTGSFVNSGTITTKDGEGVDIGDTFTGDFLNTGRIISLTPPGQEAVEIGDEFTGSFINRGLIMAEHDEAVYFTGGRFKGDFLNTGTIKTISDRGDAAVRVNYDFEGSFINRGVISVEGAEAVYFGDDFKGSFLNTGTIKSTTEEGEEAIFVDNDFEGSFINHGVISAEGDEPTIHISVRFTGTFQNTGTITKAGEEDGDAVYFDEEFEGSFVNSGDISAEDVRAISFNNGFEGAFTNRGVISSGAVEAIFVDRDFNGTFLNSGVIETDGVSAIGFDDSGIRMTNDGGRITGTRLAVDFAGGDTDLTLSGPSHIEGVLQGAPGTNDVLTFADIRGISDEKRAELIALAEDDNPGLTSVVLFGEEISWNEFEDVRVDLASLESYEDLLGPGLQGFGEALDHVLMLNDEFREFLKGLNDLSEDELNRAASTTSGQVLASGIDDFVQQQDAQLFSLFTNEFSTLRGDRSGGGGSLASNERTGFFTREVQVGVTVQEPLDTAHVFVAGYVGNASQDSTLIRSGSNVDNTSVIFGRTDHVSNEWMLGIWGGYVDNEARVDSYGSLLKNEAGYVGVNANYLSDDLFANFLLGYGFHDQFSNRRDFRGDAFEGDAVGNQGLLQAQVGRDYYFGESAGLKASPYLGFAVSALSMGGFVEDSPAISRLRFDAETTVSAQSVVGVNLSGYRATTHGWIKPKFDASWWHEFASADDYGVALATPGFLNAFQVSSPAANRDRAMIQVGLEFGFDSWESVTFDATYFGSFGEDDYSSHGGSLSASFEF